MKDYKNYLSFLAIVSFLFFAVSSAEDEGEDYENQVESIESGSESTETTETEDKKEPAKVVESTAKEIYNTYKGNEVAGNLKYKGNVVVMKNAEVLNIKQDEWKNDAIYIEIVTHGEYGKYSDLRCYMSKDHVNTAAMLSPGDRINIKGILTKYNMYITVEGCSIFE